MIFEALLNMVVSVTTTLFSIVPDLPPMPSVVVEAADAVLNFGAQPVYFLQYIFSAVLLNAVIAIFVSLFVFEKSYTTVIFVLKKIPFLNIK